MNNLWSIGTDLAKDFTGFVREVAEELQTVTADLEQEESNTDNQAIENETEFEEEQALEAELRDQLLQLSDDEDNDSIVRASNAEEYHKQNENTETITDTPTNEETESDKELQSILNESHSDETESDKVMPPESEQKHEQKKQTNWVQRHNALQPKYTQLKQNYRKSMLLVEKYQIYNKSLKETLNEQMTMREKQQMQISEHQTVNEELNQKLIKLQNEMESIGKTLEAKERSIFEASPDSEMVIKSVAINAVQTVSDSQTSKDCECAKLRKTLQKASANMKELKKRYKKVKDDLCHKIEEFDTLKSQYVTHKMSASNQLTELKNKLKESIGNGLGKNKELQMILSAEFVENEQCRAEIINPLHLAMITVLNGCTETMHWMSLHSTINNIGKSGMNIDDSKSDSVVIVDESNNVSATESVEMSVTELDNIKMSVVSLREVVCDYIAAIQQWIKIINAAIDRKRETGQTMGNGKTDTASSTTEFQNID